MKRRLLCILLSVLILISLVPAMAFPAVAASNMTTSEECIEILKEMEGFLKYAVYDNGQYTIGYGSGCGKNEYPNGITEEEADALLRKYLENMGKAVNTFADRYQLRFSQNQFDALMLFSYNCGTNWVNSDGEFRKAVISGATGNDFLYPFCLWSNAGGELNLVLVKRRLIEADIYLNGNYSNIRPAHYTYVVFDHNGGISDVKVQGYDSNLTDLVRPVPALSGSRFLGWYTTAEGGSWVTRLTAKHGGTTLYAHWQTGEGDAANGTPASYQLSVDKLDSRNIHNAPGGTVTGTLGEGEQANIVADYVDGSNVKWGKLDKGGWVKLGSPLVGTDSNEGSMDAVKVTVITDGVNIRSGPGITYGVIGTANTGDQLTITETRSVGGMLWGKFSKGWISLQYTDYDKVTGGSSEEDTDVPAEPEEVIAIGTVQCDLLNIRSGPGTAYGTVGALRRGTKVEITRKQMANELVWGKIAQGWIALTYVKVEPVETEPEETTPPTQPEEPTTPTEPEEPTTPTQPEEPTTPTEPENPKVTGTVNCNGGLNIRSAPGTHNVIVGYYRSGDKVEILEQTNYSGMLWGRTDKGWISMQYVKLDTPATDIPDDGKDDTSGAAGVTGTVTTQSGVNIRSGPGTNHRIVGCYRFGTKITVLEQQTIGGTAWGRTDLGWVCLTYVKLDGNVPEQTPDQDETPGQDETPAPEVKPDPGVSGVNGTVISNSPLNIRTGPGTNNPQIGVYRPGTRITILEQTMVNGQAWGRTDLGWVSMQYVMLDADAQASYVATVTASSLCIRSGAGTDTTVVGYYMRGDKVEILETTYVHGVAWGRTVKGWISLAYVQK